MLLCGDGSVALFCFFSSLFHESGHFLMMLRFHCPPQNVIFGAGGIVITRAGGRFVSCRAEIFIAFGGIIANAVLAMLSLAAFFWLQRQQWLLLFWVNLLLPALNLLPVQSLDLWTALSAVCAARLDDLRAQAVLKRISNITTIAFVVFTIAYFIFISQNFSLAAVCVYLILLNARAD